MRLQSYASLASAILRLGCLAPPALAVQSRAGEVVVCTQVKDEMPYLLEWIEYYKASGVDRIDIYDDGSADGVQNLAELYEAHNRTYLRVLKAVRASATDEFTFVQAESFTDCLNRHKLAAWVGFFDTDEYVVIAHQIRNKCVGRPLLKCFLERYANFGSVHFRALRFSSSGQIHRHLSSYEEQPLNCSGLTLHGAKPDEIWGRTRDGSPCIRSELRQGITQSHQWRGPSPDIPAESYSKLLAKHPECSDWELMRRAGGWRICEHGHGKSFVQPLQCARYGIHACEVPRFLLCTKTVSVCEARMNHYYVRSTQDACIHAHKDWKSDPLIIYKYVDANFFHIIKDDEAAQQVPQSILRRVWGDFACAALGRDHDGTSVARADASIDLACGSDSLLNVEHLRGITCALPVPIWALLLIIAWMMILTAYRVCCRWRVCRGQSFQYFDDSEGDTLSESSTDEA
mmetsp:Transcript_113162/g.292706  ORF Transcript_113162/g.292706 Transcript_113162/m.292706 type:complete len:459 (-) Transcript_113162:78-1454(-)